jgi:hypothetical protein
MAEKLSKQDAEELERAIRDAGPIYGSDGIPLAVEAILDRRVGAAVAQARAEERAALAEAFTGDDYEENAQEAAGDGEWSWFRWLALSTLDPGWPHGRAAAVEAQGRGTTAGGGTDAEV